MKLFVMEVTGNRTVKVMRRIFQVLIYNSNSGFSLIEVIVPVAITAITVAAAASAILVSQKTEIAANFYLRAMQNAEAIQAAAYGLNSQVTNQDNRTQPDTMEDVHTISGEGMSRHWNVFTIQSDDGDRRILMAVHMPARP